MLLLRGRRLVVNSHCCVAAYTRGPTLFDDAEAFDKHRQQLDQKFEEQKKQKKKKEEKPSSSGDSSASIFPDEPLIVKSSHPAVQLRTTLNERHRTMAEGGVPPAIYENEKAKWELAERFGRYGLSSGVDIRRLWPTVEEIQEIGNLRMYRDAKDAMRIATEKQTAEKERVAKRVAEIKANWADYDRQMAEFEQSRIKVESERTEQEERLEARIREIQEYFGYWIDPKDPRFEVMLQQKEMEEKKAAKKAKSEVKKSKSVGQIINS